MGKVQLSPTVSNLIDYSEVTPGIYTIDDSNHSVASLPFKMDYFNGSLHSILCPCYSDSADRNLSGLQALPVMYVQPFFCILAFPNAKFPVCTNAGVSNRCKCQISPLEKLCILFPLARDYIVPLFRESRVWKKTFARPCLCLLCGKQSVLLDDEHPACVVLRQGPLLNDIPHIISVPLSPRLRKALKP